MGRIFDFMEKKMPISFGTLFSKTAIFSKECPKNNKQKSFFFIKSKMLPICNFYKKFSVSGVFELFLNWY